MTKFKKRFLCSLLALFLVFVITLCAKFSFIAFYQHLDRAQTATSVEIAKTELQTVLFFLEEKGLTSGNSSLFYKLPKNDIGYFYSNLKAAYLELEALPTDVSALEKSNVLMKIQDSIKNIYQPDKIELYPFNSLLFWCFLIAGLSTIYNFIKCILAFFDSDIN